jgi:hypothetical protein
VQFFYAPIMKRIALAIFAIGSLLYACQNPPAPAQEDPAAAEVPASYTQKGKEIASATFLALSTTLKAALEEGGVPGAVGYCQTQALPIVDSMATFHGVNIRRTTLKVRNPADAPTDRERAVLQQYQETVDSGTPPGPITEWLGETEIAFYAPIMTNDFCLQCHGVPGETLTLENQQHIQQLYPNDEAIGYQAGELRGMWSITLPVTE